MTPNIDVAERMKLIAARINEGRASYAGREAAWHSLGTVFGEYKTWKELLEAAKNNFMVIKKQLEFGEIPVSAWGTFRVDMEVPQGLEGKSIRVKSTQTGEVRYLSFLGSVGEGYEVIQHTEGFELLDSLVGSIDGAHYETMGNLDFGRLVWGQVDPKIDIRVGEDISKVYLTYHTSHDGSKAFDIFETGVREVCRNTFRLGSLKRLANSLRVKHTKSAHKRIEDMKAELEEIRSVALSMQEKLTWLAHRKVTMESMDRIMDRLFPKKQTEDGEESSTRRENNIAAILSLYESNDRDTFKEQRGTAYNLFNAVTEYTDHYRTTKGNMRAESAVFGSGDKLKQSALAAILAEAEGMPVKEESIQVDWTGLGLNVKAR